VVRTESGLRHALQRLDGLLGAEVGGAVAAVARMIAVAALHHRGTRGAHWRADVPRALSGARVVVTAPDRGRPVARVPVAQEVAAAC
jgi:aspartate oxidase